MALKGGRRYVGTVVSGALMQSAVKKTPGFQVYIECEDGEIDHTVWLSAKNKDRAMQDFETLGIRPEQLQSRAFVQHEMGSVVVGRQVEVETKEEEFKGTITVKVASISPVGAHDPSELASAVVSLFGGSTPPSAAPVADDDPIPF